MFASGERVMRILGCLLMMALLIFQSESSVQAARSAMRVWGLDVVPSLFPYMVLCRMLTPMLKGASLPPEIMICVLGLSGGSPSGAAMLAACPMTWCKRYWLSALTGTISPMFYLATLKQWFGHAADVRLLLIANWTAAAVSACILALHGHKAQKEILHEHDGQCVEKEGAKDAIVQSVNAVMTVGGCIVFYSVMASSAASFFQKMPAPWRAALHALLEVSGGMKALSAADLARNAKLILASALCGFSGLSILAQNAYFLRPHGIGLKHLVGIAALRAMISVFIMWVLLMV